MPGLPLSAMCYSGRQQTILVARPAKIGIPKTQTWQKRFVQEILVDDFSPWSLELTSDIRRENSEPFNWISDENNSCGISLRNQTGNHAKLCNTSSQSLYYKFVIFRWLTSSNQLENNQEQVNCIIIIIIIIIIKTPQTNTPPPKKEKK